MHSNSNNWKAGQEAIKLGQLEWKEHRSNNVSAQGIKQHNKQKQLQEQMKIDIVNQNLKMAIDEQKKDIKNSRDVFHHQKGSSFPLSK